MRITSIFLLILVLLTGSSCFKEDDRVTPHAKGDLSSDTIALTQDYRYQAWFSLDSGQVVRTMEKTAYDLGFECGEKGWRILLNTANFMKVADLGTVPFGQPYDTVGKTLRFDKSDGNPDSTAIGEWFTVSRGDTVTKGHVYAISRGIDEAGNPLGLYQFILDSLKTGVYYFRYAPLAGGTGISASVGRDPARSYAWFSLPLGETVQAEPPKTAFDLLFTQYTTMLYTDAGEPYPYLVTGALLNRHLVVAAMDTVTDFFSINRETALAMDFSKAMDFIGYDWKDYDFNSGVYTVKPRMNYVLRSAEGYYYKMRFVGFYNKAGLKGYPVIEYQRL